ncbi:hypothetical protein [Scytonema hofmannii]
MEIMRLTDAGQSQAQICKALGCSQRNQSHQELQHYYSRFAVELRA